MNVFVKVFRAIRIVGVFAYSIGEVVITRPRTRAERATWLQKLCKRLLRSVHITCTTSGPVPMSGGVISNHLSYVDILLHGSIRPCVFVSKIEVRRLPVMGWVSFMAGTVYVERGAGGSARKAAEGMAKGFRDGLPVVFFPEGTTGTDDTTVMPFHSGLLAQALAAGASISPGFLRYQLSPQDLSEGRSPATDIHWGPQTLPAHLWNLLGLRPIHAHLHFGPEPVRFSPAALKDRKLAAVEAHDAVLTLARTGIAGESTLVPIQK